MQLTITQPNYNLMAYTAALRLYDLIGVPRDRRVSADDGVAVGMYVLALNTYPYSVIVSTVGNESSEAITPWLYEVKPGEIAVFDYYKQYKGRLSHDGTARVFRSLDADEDETITDLLDSINATYAVEWVKRNLRHV